MNIPTPTRLAEKGPPINAQAYLCIWCNKADGEGNKKCAVIPDKESDEIPNPSSERLCPLIRRW